MDVIIGGSAKHPASTLARVTARNVTLTLCAPDGEILGDLEPFIVSTPHLQDMDLVVQEAERLLSQQVVVLRLLRASPSAAGTLANVNYLAQVSAEPAELKSTSVVRVEHPQRMPWAVPGGPDADLEWARDALSKNGIRILGRPRQIRSWNLSSIWQITTDEGTVWLKAVPPFFAHEADIVTALGSFHAPRVIASQVGLTLYQHAPGLDAYGAPVALRIEMLRHLTDIHMSFTENDIHRRGWALPDWRPDALKEDVVDVLAAVGDALSADNRYVLDSYLDRWDITASQLVACGVPFTLVHGDFHPGNVRVSERGITIIDWADSGLGHPGFDVETCAQGLKPGDGALLRETWGAMWDSHRPGVDAPRALQLLPPMAALRRATVYQRFLRGVEPDEHLYHAEDPTRWLTAAADLISVRVE